MSFPPESLFFFVNDDETKHSALWCTDHFFVFFLLQSMSWHHTLLSV